MSTDRFTEILNYLSAISRDVGELRQEFRQFREEANARFEKMELRFGKIEGQLETLRSEQRETVRLISRVAGALQIFRSDIDESDDRVTALERKGA
jgi:septal ring factor EnvC (AmiA/AmiB activator)